MQRTSQLPPPQRSVPPQLLAALQLISHALAFAQSTPRPQAPVTLQRTTQRHPLGQVIAAQLVLAQLISHVLAAHVVH